MRKPAPTDRPIHPLLAERWSPYAFTGEDVTRRICWPSSRRRGGRPSSYNAQPWRFILARRREPGAFEKGALVPRPVQPELGASCTVLALGLVHGGSAAGGSPIPVAAHDLGLAAASLTVEATHRGLAVHQMSGIVADRSARHTPFPRRCFP